MHYAQSTNRPDLSTDAHCCPLVPLHPQAKPQTPTLWWPFLSCLISLPFFTSQTNICPLEEEPDAMYKPTVEKKKESRSHGEN